MQPSSALWGDREDLAVLVLNGVNLSQLRARNPHLYGTQSLAELIGNLRRHHRNLEAFSSESESALVERIHAARTDGTDALVINPGAWTHYSYALRDALELISAPKAEVHLSHTLGRAAFRHHSTVSPVVDVTITGLGVLGYRLAIDLLLRIAAQRSHTRPPLT